MNHQGAALSANVILAMMVCTAVAATRAMLPVEGPPDGDFPLFLIPWMDIIRERGLASISGEFSAYTPPYIYLLNLASLIEPAVGTVAAVKLVNLPFVALLCWGIGALVVTATGNRDLAKIAAAVALVSPTLLVNAFAYGQADVIFTAFLVWFVVFAMRDRPGLAASMFGVALAFKFQALLLSPLLLYLLVSKQMRLRELLLVPAAYAAMMLPAALAGRPWEQLLTILLRQGALKQELSLYAPNPWWLLRDYVDYQTGLAIGLVLGGLAALLIVALALRLERTRLSLLIIAAVTAALMPYVLPKMAARYFFIADLITIALAFVRPNLWPAAVLMQAGSLIAMLGYFDGRPTASLGFFPTTFAVAIILYHFGAASLRRPAQ